MPGRCKQSLSDRFEIGLLEARKTSTSLLSLDGGALYGTNYNLFSKEDFVISGSIHTVTTQLHFFGTSVFCRMRWNTRTGMSTTSLLPSFMCKTFYHLNHLSSPCLLAERGLNLS